MDASIRYTALWLLRLTMLALTWTGAVPSYGATQGTRGPTTSGTVDITYVQGINVRITGLADMALGTWSGTGPLTAEDNICIGRTGVGPFSNAGTYRILARGDGEPGNPAAFTLSNGATRINYRAFFNDQAGTGGRQELTPGQALTGQSSLGQWYFFNMAFNCAVENANISIEVPEAELSSANGAYVGILTLTLTPE